eukprot:6983642-Ditylum_brightwellii.AAC.1
MATAAFSCYLKDGKGKHHHDNILAHNHHFGDDSRIGRQTKEVISCTSHHIWTYILQKHMD